MSITISKDGRVYGDPLERFWYHSNATRSLGCWLWGGSLNSYGYGRIVVGGSRILAHRYAYEQFVGPIPEGMQLDHLCLNKRCVNPAHLEAVSGAVNTQRAGAITRSRHATCKAGHAWTPENTYVRPSTGRRSCRTCVNGYVRAYIQRKRKITTN